MKDIFDEHAQVTAIMFGSVIVITAIIAYTAIILKGMN